jgi:uncharacterized protein (TIGR01777 family)
VKIVIAGAGGFVGSNLKNRLVLSGHEIVSLSGKELNGSVEGIFLKLKNAEVVINLAGASILRRWTEKNRKLIYNSRIETTRKLCNVISLIERKPRLFIQASAIGIYIIEGSHSESSVELSDDFLGKVCKDWENEAKAIVNYSELTIFRFGVILARKGGSFPRMILPFRLFLGGTIAGGNQLLSWVHIEDVLNVFLFVINNPGGYGVINVCSPNPITNAAFSKAASAIYKRPAFFNIPQFLLRMIYGEAAELVTRGQYVIPEKLVKAGFSFEYPDITAALKELSGK